MIGYNAVRAIKALSYLLSAGVLAACMATPPGLMDERPGQTLTPGQSRTMHFFTDNADLDTGVILEASGHYGIQINFISHWIDSYIAVNENDEPLDEMGFANSQMPYAWLGSLRRSTSHQWFELMLYQPRCAADSLRGVSDLQLNESSGSYQFVAACDGKLALFVNDNYLTYSNNSGYANIAISRVSGPS